MRKKKREPLVEVFTPVNKKSLTDKIKQYIRKLFWGSKSRSFDLSQLNEKKETKG